MSPELTFKAIPTEDLIPKQWLHLNGELVNFFNMALIETDDGYLVAYRFVSAVDSKRRIGIARLSKDFEVKKGSALPISDQIEFFTEVPQQSAEWFADPRLFRLNGKIYMVWNNGHTDDETNHQYMVEIDSATGMPTSKAREIILRSGRRKTEKNWAFFEAEGSIWAVYSVSPHKILRVDLESSESEVLCDIDNISSWKSTFGDVFGALRGGAQPIRVGDRFINIVHSRYNMPDGVEYVAAAYEFSASYPFHPLREKPYSLNLGFDPHSDPSQHGFIDNEELKLNHTTSWVIYPTGFSISGDSYIISGGYNDSHCFVSTGPISHIQEDMKTIKSSPQPKILPVGSVDVTALNKDNRIATKLELPLFWWMAKGRQMNGAIYSGEFKHGNFGDDASALLVERLSGFTPVQPAADQSKLLAIGSVLHRASSGDVIWGSGLKSSDALDEHPGGDIFVKAVRGPMTLEVLKRNGWDISNIEEMFDPGVLLAHLWKSELAKQTADMNKAKGKIRILPHYRDEIVFRRWNPKLQHHFISADNHPLTVLRLMAGAELVISSSLHGIIFAESLGIPAIWIDSPGKEGHFKYQDYYAGTGRSNIKAVDTIQEAMKASAPEVPKFDFEKLLATFPANEIVDLQSRSIGSFKGVLFTSDLFNSEKRKFSVGWSKNIVKTEQAMWVRGLSGSLTLQPKNPESLYASIRVQLIRCDTRLSPFNQEVTITTSAGSQATVIWNRKDLRSKVVALPVSHTEVRNGLTLHIKAKTVGPQKSWNSPFPFASVGIVTLRSE